MGKQKRDSKGRFAGGGGGSSSGGGGGILSPSKRKALSTKQVIKSLNGQNARREAKLTSTGKKFAQAFAGGKVKK